MAQKDLIVVSDDPKIPLAELWAADTGEDADSPVIRASSSIQSTREKTGSEKPYIKINAIQITEIDQLIIDETGVIPKVKAIFTDVSGALSGANYPKNDPIMSVYIKSQNEKFKPIRCDFLITSIKTNQDPVLNAEIIHKGATFIMSGELFIPKIYDNVSRSYKDMNSKETLKSVAIQNNLGFACNDFTTNDKMTWLNTNKSSLSFISHVSKHSYLNDDAFFTAFIDKYYHLTFVNIAEQLNPAHEHNTTFDNHVDSSELDISQEAKKQSLGLNDEVLSIVGLTNMDSYKGKPEFTINYSLMGDTGSILKNKGFKKQVYYYDSLLDGDKLTSFFVKPIQIKGYKGESSSLIPDNESLKESIIKKWMNIDYGNAHTEWNASVLINDHNNSELNKVKLKVETAGINFQITRGNAVPVMLVLPGQSTLESSAHRSDVLTDGQSSVVPDDKNVVKDVVLSGKYYVSGVKYTYDSLNDEYPFITEFQLARVNWLGEKKITN
jgi:hypothetical protein